MCVAANEPQGIAADGHEAVAGGGDEWCVLKAESGSVVV